MRLGGRDRARRPGAFRDEAPEYKLAFARLVTHYWSHGSWLDEGIVLRDAGRLARIPGILVQGTLTSAT